jgi:hypothetical protein
MGEADLTIFWFVSAPLAGHLDWGGMLKTAQALRDSGHGVLWVSQPAIGPALADAGVDFAPIPETGWLWPPPPLPDPASLKPAEAMLLRYRRALDTWLSEDLIPPAVEALLTLARERGKPDALVTDPFLTAAAFAAEALDVPLAVAGWPAGLPLDEDQLLPVQAELGRASRERGERLKTRLGLRGVNFSARRDALRTESLAARQLLQPGVVPERTGFLPQTQFVGGNQKRRRRPNRPGWPKPRPGAARIGDVGQPVHRRPGILQLGGPGRFARLGMIPIVVWAGIRSRRRKRPA